MLSSGSRYEGVPFVFHLQAKSLGKPKSVCTNRWKNWVSYGCHDPKAGEPSLVTVQILSKAYLKIQLDDMSAYDLWDNLPQADSSNQLEGNLLVHDSSLPVAYHHTWCALSLCRIPQSFLLPQETWRKQTAKEFNTPSAQRTSESNYHGVTM